MEINENRMQKCFANKFIKSMYLNFKKIEKIAIHIMKLENCIFYLSILKINFVCTISENKHAIYNSHWTYILRINQYNF